MKLFVVNPEYRFIGGALAASLLPFITACITVILMADSRYVEWIDGHIRKSFIRERRRIGTAVELAAVMPFMILAMFGSARLANMMVRTSPYGSLCAGLITAISLCLLIAIYVMKSMEFDMEKAVKSTEMDMEEQTEEAPDGAQEDASQEASDKASDEQPDKVLNEVSDE